MRLQSLTQTLFRGTLLATLAACTLSTASATAVAPGPMTFSPFYQYNLVPLNVNEIGGSGLTYSVSTNPDGNQTIKLFGDLSFTSAEGGLTSLEIILNGTGTGNFPDDYMGYNIDLNFSGVDTLVSWEGTLMSNQNQVALSGQTQSPGNVKESGNIYVGAGNFNFTWSVDMKASFIANAPGDTLTISIPQNSIDLNAVPEPASFLLFAPAVALLYLRRKRQ